MCDFLKFVSCICILMGCWHGVQTYFGPLDALCFAICTTGDVPTKTDKRVISALKKIDLK